jgi:competence protein ComEA
MRDRIGHFFNHLLGASSSEVGGIIILISLIALGVVSVYAFDEMMSTGYTSKQEDARKLDSLIALMESSPEAEVIQASVLYKFNPNTVDFTQLLQLGLDSTISARLIKYRSKGGRFKIKSDLAKIYGLKVEQYQSLEPFILLPTVKKVQTSKPKVQSKLSYKAPPSNTSKPVKPLQKFNLNTADTATYQTIFGIGSVLAYRIVRFRDKLGGFVSLNQLYEVYNLDSTVISTLTGQSFILEEFNPELIYINTFDESSLAAHPYISFQQAKLIIAYRNQHRDYKDEKDLASVYSIDEEFILKLKPYISFQNP